MVRIKVVTWANRKQYRVVLERYFRIRYDIYVKRRQWRAVARPINIEMDAFDTEHAVYLLALDRAGKIVGGSRLVPTLQPHLLGNVFPARRRAACCWRSAARRRRPTSSPLPSQSGRPRGRHGRRTSLNGRASSSVPPCAPTADHLPWRVSSCAVCWRLPANLGFVRSASCVNRSGRSACGPLGGVSPSWAMSCSTRMAT